MNCVHCGAELSDREEICTLCGKLANVPDEPGQPTVPAEEDPPAPPSGSIPPAEPAAPPSTDNPIGAAFCPACKKYVYLDNNGCCERGHQVSGGDSGMTETPNPVAGSAPAVGFGVLHDESMYANNSGRGTESSLPAELEGVNWGGFLLTWIWGIGNKVWLSFLWFVPGGYYVMPWVLLIKGNEWAWKNKQWHSIQEFREVQRKWAIAGIVLAVIGVLATCSIYFFAISAGVMADGSQATINNRVTPY